MSRLLIIAVTVWTAIAVGRVALTTALSIPELTARAAAEARW